MFKSLLINKQDIKQNTIMQYLDQKKSDFKSFTTPSIQKKATFRINYLLLSTNRRQGATATGWSSAVD
ncbi:MAG: hypothetical protein BGO31_09215 [Bacteroidetes bacterium 43-16]|nr:MAG: hypothetical protein BGO31_09215 [Bacteroidetes bacterium 43-16]